MKTTCRSFSNRSPSIPFAREAQRSISSHGAASQDAMALKNLHSIRALYRASPIRQSSYIFGSSISNSSGISNEVPEVNQRNISTFLFKGENALPWTPRSTTNLHSAMASELEIFKNDTRLASTQAGIPAQARQMGALKVSMTSPGFVYEPYAPREEMPFWRRWLTRSGWRRTKEEIKLELKSAYAIAKLRKTGYSKQIFYKEAAKRYKEINILMANGEKSLLRKAVTDNMYSALKNEIKQREAKWSKIHWEMAPKVNMRTLRARLIGVDRNDLKKVFIQLTIEFITKQKFEAYDSNGKVVAGDKNKEVLVKDIWVFEKSLFHPGAFWRLCGRISL